MIFRQNSNNNTINNKTKKYKQKLFCKIGFEVIHHTNREWDNNQRLPTQKEKENYIIKIVLFKGGLDSTSFHINNCFRPVLLLK